MHSSFAGSICMDKSCLRSRTCGIGHVKLRIHSLIDEMIQNELTNWQRDELILVFDLHTYKKGSSARNFEHDSIKRPSLFSNNIYECAILFLHLSNTQAKQLCLVIKAGISKSILQRV